MALCSLGTSSAVRMCLYEIDIHVVLMYLLQNLGVKGGCKLSWN